MIYKIFLAAVLAGIFSIPAWAQNPRFELGGKGGFGNYMDEVDGRGVIGAEVCVWCGGRYALFGEYSHWPAAPGNASSQSSIRAGAGLRIQRLGAWCFNACFFDAGIAMAGPFASTQKATPGAVFGAGFVIPAGQRLYVRPQIRLYAMGSNSAVSAEVGIGWRF